MGFYLSPPEKFLEFCSQRKVSIFEKNLRFFRASCREQGACSSWMRRFPVMDSEAGGQGCALSLFASPALRARHTVDAPCRAEPDLIRHAMWAWTRAVDRCLWVTLNLNDTNMCYGGKRNVLLRVVKGGMFWAQSARSTRSGTAVTRGQAHTSVLRWKISPASPCPFPGEARSPEVAVRSSGGFGKFSQYS